LLGTPAIANSGAELFKEFSSDPKNRSKRSVRSIRERLSSELLMSLTRKSREFAVDYTTNRVVSTVDSAENSD
jgi:hypothetical protein